jgi:transposase
MDIDLKSLNESQLRDLSSRLLDELNRKQNDEERYQNEIVKRDNTIAHLSLRNEQLTHELAILKRHKFDRSSEQTGSTQLRLLDEAVNEDVCTIELELEQNTRDLGQQPRTKQVAKRQALPAHLPRKIVRHDPESTECRCGCQMVHMGDDISEKLDYEPGQFSVEQHVRSKWACRQCETVVQKPVDAHVIDKGIPTTNLLAHVLVSKYADHQPLYRQQQIYQRAGVDLPSTTLSEWVGRCGYEIAPLVEALRASLLAQPILHADETPVNMLEPGNKKAKKAYVWAYATPSWCSTQAVVYDFQPSRAGESSRLFLEGWQGYLVCDDYTGYKAGFGLGMTEVACWAHARRKFHELQVNHASPIADKAMGLIGSLYTIEREAADLSPDERYALRQTQAKPVLERLHGWLIREREGLPDSGRSARAIDYTLKRWLALKRYLDDGAIPIDNNWIENQIRPWALGRKNWLFAGSLRSGQRAANIMTLIQSAKINGLDPQRYLKEVLERLPTAKRSDLESLLPHNWRSRV